MFTVAGGGLLYVYNCLQYTLTNDLKIIKVRRDLKGTERSQSSVVDGMF